jgi:hypothetical protein
LANEANWAAGRVEQDRNSGPLVAARPAKTNKIAMLNSPRNPNKKTPAAPKLVAVIKNNLTEQQMDASGEHWANHQGPYMTVAETLAYAAEKDKKRAAN